MLRDQRIAVCGHSVAPSLRPEPQGAYAIGTHIFLGSDIMCIPFGRRLLFNVVCIMYALRWRSSVLESSRIVLLDADTLVAWLQRTSRYLCLWTWWDDA